MDIKSFERTGKDTFLMDYTECKVARLASVRSRNEKYSFVYLELAPMEPSGATEIDKHKIEAMKSHFGYAWEEYATFGDHNISRKEFDDGAASIDGKVVRLMGNAELRVRYLSKYNFVIAPKDSPINNNGFDRFFEKVMNDILLGKSSVETLVSTVEQLPMKEKIIF